MAPGSGSETLVLPRTFCFVPVILLIAQNLARYAANAASSGLATRAQRHIGSNNNNNNGRNYIN